MKFHVLVLEGLIINISYDFLTFFRKNPGMSLFYVIVAGNVLSEHWHVMRSTLWDTLKQCSTTTLSVRKNYKKRHIYTRKYLKIDTIVIYFTVLSEHLVILTKNV